MLRTDLIPVVAVDDDPVPDGYRFTAAISDQICFQLQIFVLEKGTDQVLKLFIDT